MKNHFSCPSFISNFDHHTVLFLFYNNIFKLQNDNNKLYLLYYHRQNSVLCKNYGLLCNLNPHLSRVQDFFQLKNNFKKNFCCAQSRWHCCTRFQEFLLCPFFVTLLPSSVRVFVVPSLSAIVFLQLLFSQSQYYCCQSECHCHPPV